MFTIPFIKMHGAGNDFIILKQEDLPPTVPLADLVRNMCARQLGIGADQLLLIGQSQPGDHGSLYQMDTYNMDGSVGGVCGNGLRCVASYLRSSGLVRGGDFAIATPQRQHYARFGENGSVAINMGPPSFEPEELPANLAAGDSPKKPGDTVAIAVEGEEFTAVLVSMGNPHCVIFGDHKLQKRIAELGPKLENHPLFPQRSNVMFALVQDPHHINVAHWERGSGATLACGSGACATAAAAIVTGVAETPVTVKMRGGDIHIEWDGVGQDIWMSGPVAHIFSGDYYLKDR